MPQCVVPVQSLRDGKLRHFCRLLLSTCYMTLGEVKVMCP